MVANITIINTYYGMECYGVISSNIITDMTIINTTLGIVFEFVTNSIVSNSTIMDSQDVGIIIKESSRYNSITGNTIINNKRGIQIDSWTRNNRVYHNNFISNIQHAYANSDATWNISYPGGGNYWDTFDEPGEYAHDNFSGVDQLNPGSDGIIDQGLPLGGLNPYYIHDQGVDYYPFISPYGWINSPPDTPGKPAGRIFGVEDRTYTYTTSTTDPEGNNVYYMWSWGDGSYSAWLGPYTSGAPASASHAWAHPGSYQITVKAKDTLEYESTWSEPLKVLMRRFGLPPVPAEPVTPD
jgi:parallel beta-helix repeat protein